MAACAAMSKINSGFDNDSSSLFENDRSQHHAKQLRC
jgi:hypothetical protein